MTNAENERGRPRQESGPQNLAAVEITGPTLNRKDRLELRDLLKANGIDTVRETTADLQPGDILRCAGRSGGAYSVGVVHVEPWTFGKEMTYRKVVLVCGGRFVEWLVSLDWTNERGRMALAYGVDVCTPESVAQARAMWSERDNADRAELARLRREVTA